MLQPYWKVRKIATIAMIAANERKASRFRLATFLATVAILRTFQYGRDIIGKVYFLSLIMIVFLLFLGVSECLFRYRER